MVNVLLLLSGRPSAMGAGALAASRQSEYAKWRHVDNMRADEMRGLVTLRRGRRTVMLVQCTPEDSPVTTPVTNVMIAKALQPEERR